MFLGEYQTSFTGHGRVVLPKKFRKEIFEGKVIILSRGFEGCIWGFSLKDWEKEAARQLEIPITDPKARDLRRYLFSAAESVKLDEQGRFVIPGPLLDYAGLKDQVAIIGAGDHFEIWAFSQWQKVKGKLLNYEEIKD